MCQEIRRFLFGAFKLLVLVLTCSLFTINSAQNAIAQTSLLRPVITRDNAAQLVETLRIGKGSVYYAQWSPRGDLFVVRTTIGLWIYHPDDFKAEPRFIEASLSNFAYAFSPEGRYLIVSASQGALIYHTENLDHAQSLNSNDGGFDQLRFTPDGNYLLARSESGSLQLWSVGNKFSGGIESHVHNVDRFMISPDSKTVVTISNDGSAALLTLAALEQVAHWDATGKFSYAAFSPNSQMLLLWESSLAASVWDLTGELQQIITFNVLHGLFFNNDGSRAVIYTQADSSEGGMQLALWDLRSGQQVGSNHPINDSALIGINPATRKLLYDFGVDLYSWDFESSTEPYFNGGGVSSPGYRVVFSPDGKHMLMFKDSSSVVYVPAEGALHNDDICCLAHHKANLIDGSFKRDSSQFATWSLDGTVQLWDARTGEALDTLTGFQQDNLIAVAGEKLASGGPQGSLHVWNLKEGALRAEVFPYGSGWMPYTIPITHLVITRDGSAIFGSTEFHDAYQWDGQSAEASTLPFAEVSGLTLNDAGTELWYATGEATQYLDLKTFQISAAHPTSENSTITALGKTAAVLAKAIRRYDPTTQQYINEITITDYSASVSEPEIVIGTHQNTVRALVFAPGGSEFATGSQDGTAAVWDIATRQKRLDLAAHMGGVYSVAYSPDGSLIATAGVNRSVKVWDANTGRLLMTLYGHRSAVMAVLFSATGDRIISAGADGTIRVWSVR